MKRIAVLTSGGDAPGMNAAIRSVVRTGLGKGWEVFGVNQGYAGLIKGDIIPLGARDVGGIIHLGGTMLGSARCPEFKTVEGRELALEQLKQRGIEGLVVIGGNGSQTGAYMLHEMKFPVVGVASTIDNDLYGSDITIGVDTALNIALEAIDRLKVTASSHRRAFLVEVMGRDCGYLALMSGIAGGAESILIPEVPFDPEDVAAELRESYERGKKHGLVVVAEGCKWTGNGHNRMGADDLAKYFHEHHKDLGFELRATTLGHVQRGGAPGAFDRLLATRLSAAATDCLAQSESGVLCGAHGGQMVKTPLSEVVVNKKALDMKLVELARVLAH